MLGSVVPFTQHITKEPQIHRKESRSRPVDKAQAIFILILSFVQLPDLRKYILSVTLVCYSVTIIGINISMLTMTVRIVSMHELMSMPFCSSTTQNIYRFIWAVV